MGGLVIEHKLRFSEEWTWSQIQTFTSSNYFETWHKTSGKISIFMENILTAILSSKFQTNTMK